MPRAKKVEATPEVAEDEQPVEKVEAVRPKTEFNVLNGSGDPVRTFTVEIHGERAGELAHEFAATNGYSVQA